MKTPQLLNSFRARLVLLLVVLLGLTLGVQYYVNLRSVRRNARMLVEQEQAIMAGVALGVNSISSNKYLDQIRSTVREPLLEEPNGRVRNVLVVDSDGNVLDSLNQELRTREKPGREPNVLCENHRRTLASLEKRCRTPRRKPATSGMVDGRRTQLVSPAPFIFPWKHNKGGGM